LEGTVGETLGVLIIAAVVLFLFFRSGIGYVRAIFDPAYRRKLMKRM
jgi:hypothetical protein